MGQGDVADRAVFTWFFSLLAAAEVAATWPSHPWRFVFSASSPDLLSPPFTFHLLPVTCLPWYLPLAQELRDVLLLLQRVQATCFQESR